ncbi:unnamed protein product [Moneuplotes crassus]|uniref:Uncharacterized protein n=1 Tax=Euplotes crassus TaxID=5936 RepID=A0AAD2D005_EUPCR|nr:unnamed protein product [Moneuplotes crassus]
MKSKAKELRRSPGRKNLPTKKSYKPQKNSENFKMKEDYLDEYKTQDPEMKKEVVEMSFESEYGKSIPISSESSAKKISEMPEGDIGVIDYEKLIKSLCISQAKLKRIFNFHIKSTHNKIEFSEFLKFCKSTQIFPNFISIMYLKKLVQEIMDESNGKKAKRSPRTIERSVSNSTLLTFKDFNKSIKKMALFTVDSSAEEVAGDKIKGFIKHINVNCQYNYNVNNLISETPQTPVRCETPSKSETSLKKRTPQSFTSSTCGQREDEHLAKTEEASSRDDFNEKTSDSNMIDENINKALEALKNPRPSCPQSSEKQSNADSSKKKDFEDISISNLDQSAFRKQASNDLYIENPTKENPFCRYKSTSRSKRNNSGSPHRVKEKEELEEFLAFEESCQKPSMLNSQKISQNPPPEPQYTKNQIYSNNYTTPGTEIPNFDHQGLPDNKQFDDVFPLKSASELENPIIENADKIPDPDCIEQELAEDYDKKLQEIQEKYKKALNIGSAQESIGKKGDKTKKEIFSAEEFKKMKTLVSKREKSAKPVTKKRNDTLKPRLKPKEKSTSRVKLTKTFESKSSKKTPKSTVSKNKKTNRSRSIHRNKDLVPKPKEKKGPRKELSKPRDTKGSKTEHPGLDNIKNSILKIKEKAFSTSKEDKLSKDDKILKTLDAEMRAYVSISSIDLCNAKEKKEEESIIMKDFENIPKEIPTFSLHQEDSKEGADEPDTSNLTNKEPESYHPSESKYLPKHASSLVSTTFDKLRYNEEKTDFQNDFSKDSNFDLLVQEKPLKSLNVSKTIEASSKTLSAPLETDLGRKRTVRFEETDHIRQKSSLNPYSKGQIIHEEEKYTNSASKVLQPSEHIVKAPQWQIEPSDCSEKAINMKQEVYNPKSEVGLLEKIQKPHIDYNNESISSNFPSITNLRANVSKHQEKVGAESGYKVGVQNYIESRETPEKRIALKLTFKNLERMVQLRHREHLHEGFKKIKDMNNLCREYRSQMLLSLTKLFSVIKHKQTIHKSQALNILATKAKMEAMADSLASDATNSLKGLLMDRMKHMM